MQFSTLTLLIVALFNFPVSFAQSDGPAVDPNYVCPQATLDQITTCLGTVYSDEVSQPGGACSSANTESNWQCICNLQYGLTQNGCYAPCPGSVSRKKSSAKWVVRTGSSRLRATGQLTWESMNSKDKKHIWNIRTWAYGREWRNGERFCSQTSTLWQETSSLLSFPFFCLTISFPYHFQTSRLLLRINNTLIKIAKANTSESSPHRIPVHHWPLLALLALLELVLPGE